MGTTVPKVGNRNENMKIFRGLLIGRGLKKGSRVLGGLHG